MRPNVHRRSRTPPLFVVPPQPLHYCHYHVVLPVGCSRRDPQTTLCVGFLTEGPWLCSVYRVRNKYKDNHLDDADFRFRTLKIKVNPIKMSKRCSVVIEIGRSSTSFRIQVYTLIWQRFSKCIHLRNPYRYLQNVTEKKHTCTLC